MVLRPSSAFSLSPSLHASPSVFLPLPRFSLSHLVSPFVADSSAPEEHWGEQRKQRFGSVALILIFCRLDGRLGGAFIHTPHNHFPCNCKPWLQTTGVAAISTNVPSVTRRLYVSYLKPWLVGEHTVPNTDPKKPVRNARQEKEWNKGTTRLTQAWSKLSHHKRKEEMNQFSCNISVLLSLGTLIATTFHPFYGSSCSFWYNFSIYPSARKGNGMVNTRRDSWAQILLLRAPHWEDELEK